MVLTKTICCELIVGYSIVYWIYFMLTEKVHIQWNKRKVPHKLTIENRSKETFH